MGRIGWSLTLLAAAGLSGCVTVAEYRKLEREVLTLKRQSSLQAGGPEERLAELGAEFDAIEARVAALDGRFDVMEHQVAQALKEAQAARREAAGGATAAAGPGEGSPPPAAAGASAQEVSAYREAYGSWRTGDAEACIDRFRSFLQTYPASPYADDAAYWLADCHFKQGDYKTAILRFDDVVARRSTGRARRCCVWGRDMRRLRARRSSAW
jgi:TolA-binding protein